MNCSSDSKDVNGLSLGLEVSEASGEAVVGPKSGDGGTLRPELSTAPLMGMGSVADLALAGRLTSSIALTCCGKTAVEGFESRYGLRTVNKACLGAT